MVRSVVLDPLRMAGVRVNRAVNNVVIFGRVGALRLPRGVEVATVGEGGAAGHGDDGDEKEREDNFHAVMGTNSPARVNTWGGSPMAINKIGFDGAIIITSA